MKVLMTADTVGGVWSYCIELARALQARRVEIALATMGAPLSPEQRAEVETLDNVRIYESSYRLEWMPDPWPDVQAAGDWLLAIGAEIKPDLVHLNNYAHGDLPWNAPVLMVAHSCVASWWQATLGEPTPTEWARYRRAVTDGLTAADAVIAPTRAMLKMLTEQYGALRAWQVIPNARDPRHFPAAQKEPFILTAGRLWDKAKNVQAMVEVAPRLNWPVVLAGETEGPDGSVAQLTGVEALGRVTVETLARWYARASIYALSARYEPFGLSALEAALAGCALVLSDIPSLREVWSDTPLFVPVDDHEALQGALKTLIANEELRRRYAVRARARALRFTPRRMAAAYYSAYRELTGRPAHMRARPVAGEERVAL